MSGTDNSTGKNGTAFGPYRVFERIGVGGMATVHRAKEIGIEGFERWVALKRLLPHLAEDASFVRAFVREAKLASLLAHPNVVQIYELGRVGHVYFISMELIEGYDIRQILRQAKKIAGPPPIPVVLALLAQICEALDYAHARGDEDGNPLGLVHRDVSPSNVIVSHSGHIKVIDFGIAKAQTQQLQTQTGKVKGKMAYMSPEAIRGAAIDHRSDLFSLGVLAHELLTARPLFATKNDYKTLQRVQTAVIAPPSTFNRDCPPELDAIVLRALDRDRDERWQTAGEIRDELNALRKQPHMNAQPREIVEWLRWAFTRVAPITGTTGPYRVGMIETPQAGSRPSVVLGRDLSLETPVTGPPQVPVADVALPLAEDDDEIIEIAWGGRSSHDAVVLDEVPDVSGRSGPGLAAAAAPGTTPRPSARSGATPAPSAGLSTPAPTAKSGATLITHVPPPPTRAPRSWATGTSPPGALEAEAPEADDELRFDRAPLGAPAAAPDAVPLPLPDPRSTPIVRFKSTGEQPALPPLEPITPPAPAPAPAPVARPTSPMRGATSIGTSIVERGQRRTRATIAGAVLLLGGGAALAAYLATRDRAPVATAPAAIATSTLKLVIEPADATVRVTGPAGRALAFTSSPVATELPAGAYDVTVERTGFKPWRAPIEMTDDANQLLHIVLAPDDSERASEAVATPAPLTTAPLPAREPRRRRDVAPTLERPEQPLASAGDEPGVLGDTRSAAAALPLGGIEPPRAPRAAPTEIVVPPTAVRKIRGAVPKLVTRGDELPARISAELCMNTDGRVDRVKILTTVPDHAVTPLERALLTWRYRPYQHEGRTVRACFAVTFRAR